MPRKYSMERRNADVGETRQRIVDATMALHNEKGILATSMQDIAARAGVALGTVYRHFPSLDVLVPACGARNMELNPPPALETFAGLGNEARIPAIFAALYAHYEALERAYFVGHAEAPKLRVLQSLMEQADAYVRSLVSGAVAPLHPTEEGYGLAVVMADFFTWYAFNRAGFSSNDAAGIAAGIVLAHLINEEGGA